jgi:hypothetical protein
MGFNERRTLLRRDPMFASAKRLRESIAARSILLNAARHGWKIETAEVAGQTVTRVYVPNKPFTYYEIYTA